MSAERDKALREQFDNSPAERLSRELFTYSFNAGIEQGRKERDADLRERLTEAYMGIALLGHNDELSREARQWLTEKEDKP